MDENEEKDKGSTNTQTNGIIFTEYQQLRLLYLIDNTIEQLVRYCSLNRQDGRPEITWIYRPSPNATVQVSNSDNRYNMSQ